MKILSNRKYRKLLGALKEYKEALRISRRLHKNSEKAHEIQLSLIVQIFNDVLERVQEGTAHRVVEEMLLNFEEQK